MTKRNKNILNCIIETTFCFQFYLKSSKSVRTFGQPLDTLEQMVCDIRPLIRTQGLVCKQIVAPFCPLVLCELDRKKVPINSAGN